MSPRDRGQLYAGDFVGRRTNKHYRRRCCCCCCRCFVACPSCLRRHRRRMRTADVCRTAAEPPRPTIASNPHGNVTNNPLAYRLSGSVPGTPSAETVRRLALSARPSVRPSVCLYPFRIPSASARPLSACPSVRPPVCLSVHLSTCCGC